MRALVIVDLQNDFMPEGALGVPEADRIVPLINRLIGKFDIVVASQDYHPCNHCSLISNHPGRRVRESVVINGLSQIIWPDHCIEGTYGSRLVEKLDQSRLARVFHKGTHPEYDSYSCFFDNGHFYSTGLDDFLRQAGADQIYLCGLTIDYCVKYSAIDAVACGFDTYVILDACRGIDMIPGDLHNAITEMVAAGVRIITADTFLEM